jgi:hypothetical protein
VKVPLQAILSKPYSEKLLKDELEALMNFQASQFRIIYKISEKYLIEVIATGPR